RSRADTRRRLLEAATELFAREGLHGATSTRIARAAGVATGTFYLHFPDKQGLFREIVLAALAELRARVRSALEGSGADPRAQVRARTAELVTFAEEKRHLIGGRFGRRRAAGGGAAGDGAHEGALVGVVGGAPKARQPRAGDRNPVPDASGPPLRSPW